MKKTILVCSLIASLTAIVAFSGASPVFSNQHVARLLSERHTVRERSARKTRSSRQPLSYRGPGATHKLLIKADDVELQQRLITSKIVQRSQRYSGFTLVDVTADGLDLLEPSLLARATLRDDLNLILLRAGQIDTTGREPRVPESLREKGSKSHSLHMVQLFGPPTPDALAALESTGARVVSYIPNNAYLLWVTRNQLARVRDLTRASAIFQWNGPFHPAYKLNPHFKLGSFEQIPVSIQVFDNASAPQTLAAIKSVSRNVLMREMNAAGSIHIKVSIESIRLPEVAEMADVIAIEPWIEPKLHDERANQIVSGSVVEESAGSRTVARPTAPGYLSFLASVGFTSNLEVVVDVADSGFDSGSSESARLHRDFLDAAGNSRVQYLHDFTLDSTADPTHDSRGHGTLNASILAGFNQATGLEFNDSLGFSHGLGVAPFARIGSSKIFDNNGNFRVRSNLSDYILQAYVSGARISSNSWGSCNPSSGFCNFYGDDSIIFDSLVRDADPFAPGNQSMTIVFSAGNDGEDLGSVSIPGTGKNVITVGASENFRQGASEGAVTDGCDVGGNEADNALDVVEFSSNGPVEDGRIKPDIMAPGTHIQGAASQDPAFNGASVCGIPASAYFPPGQTLYTWSSGTSHAAPMVAGGAALAYEWLRSRSGAAPSPALVKALLLNSTNYLSGALAGGDLPGPRQGWGLMNLGRAFETTDRIILDEDASRTFTISGGPAFETTGIIGDAAKEIRAMLVWTDPPGSSTTNAPYVNQLNLEVVVNGVVYNGNNFKGQYSLPGGQPDILNNTQAVRLPPGTSGSLVVRVSPAVIAGDGVPGNGLPLDQDFALVVTNVREAPVPVLVVESADGISNGVTVEHPDGARDSFLIPGQASKITITVKNESAAADAVISAAELTLIRDGNPVNTSTASFPVVRSKGSEANPAAFQLPVPADTRCGSAAEFALKLTTSFGATVIPVRIRVGRPTETSPTQLLFDDVDGGLVKWKLKRFSVDQSVAQSGVKSYHAVDPGSDGINVQLSTLLQKKRVAIPAEAGNIRLSFRHIFNFEPGFDGGVIEISTDNGETWQDLGSRILAGGYDGKLTDVTDNPLGNRFAWTARGRPGVFSQVVINLDEFAGQRIRLRFLAGFDETTGVLEGFTGWFIDDIRITSELFGCQSRQ